MKISEDFIHITLIDYLRTKRINDMPLLFYHVPNGGQRNAREGAKFRRMGVLAGVSDICIAEPIKPHHGLYLEIKAAKGRLSDKQKEFIQKAQVRGYATAVCYSVDEGKQIIDDYLAGNLVAA